MQRRHTLLGGENKIAPYFLPSTHYLDKIKKRDVHKNLLCDWQLTENLPNGSQVLHISIYE
jgi:hypothetical protein